MSIPYRLGAKIQRVCPHCGHELPVIPLPRPFLKVIEAAYIARVQPWVIRDWFRKGWLRRYGTARRALVSQDELLTLLEREYELGQQGQVLNAARRRKRGEPQPKESASAAAAPVVAA